MVGDLSTTAKATYGIGNAFRTAGTAGVSANLEGSIAEVRISGIARGAGDMLLTAPKPSSTALPGLGGLALILRRRRAEDQLTQVSKGCGSMGIAAFLFQP